MMITKYIVLYFIKINFKINTKLQDSTMVFFDPSWSTKLKKKSEAYTKVPCYLHLTPYFLELGLYSYSLLIGNS